MIPEPSPLGAATRKQTYIGSDSWGPLG